jgi:septal ring factor EnvC (AmiA/AmiB activator)
MGQGSNKERIARAAEEARAAEAEKAEKRAAKKASPARPKRVVKPVRMKIVWEACSPAGVMVKTFAYPDKAAAEAATEALSRSTGHQHLLRAAKVPME